MMFPLVLESYVSMPPVLVRNTVLCEFGRTVYRTLHWAPGSTFCKSSANYNVALCISLYFPPKSSPPAPQHYFQGTTITVASFFLLPRTKNLRQINLKVHVLIQRCFDQIWVGKKGLFPSEGHLFHTPLFYI